MAKFELWKQKVSSTNDHAVKLQHLRELRECAATNKEAALELAMNYASGNFGNVGPELAAIFVKQVGSLLTNIGNIVRFCPGLTFNPGLTLIHL